MQHRVLIVTTSTARAGEDGPETGFDWISLAAPYWRLHEAGIRIGFASVKGGKPPGDPATARDPESENRAGAVDMFLGDGAAVDALAHSSAVDRVDATQWDALLIADGLGGLWDLAQSAALEALIETLWARGALVAAIGAGAVGLAGVRREDGRALVSGLRMTCLPDAAADVEGVTPPVKPESLLRDKGAEIWIAGKDDAPVVIEEGRLITAQDARGAAELALQLLDALDAGGPGASAERGPRPGDPNVAPETRDDGLPATAIPPGIE